ncbi:MAG: DUF488 domain-containing protein [Anaerolineae bacterium]|nr:DUF488 domain-containing protein [Anaerolineae bacterium]
MHRAQGAVAPRPTIYTFGTQRRRLAELVALAGDLDALVVDVRLAPRSRVREWNQAVMAAALGDRYLHVGVFGNLNYKTAGAPVRLRDPEAGIAALEPARAAGQSVILVCYEEDPAHCHRRDVAGLLHARWGWLVVHLLRGG